MSYWTHEVVRRFRQQSFDEMTRRGGSETQQWPPTGRFERNKGRASVMRGPVRCWVTVFASAPLGRWSLVAANGWYPGHWDRTPSSSTTTVLSVVFQPVRETKKGGPVMPIAAPIHRVRVPFIQSF